MIVGFTGTRHGMTRWQKKRVAELLIEWGVKYAHHGCCIGADTQFDTICESLGIKRVGWPSNIPSMTRIRPGMYFINERMSPLKRNEVIAKMDRLIACPKERSEVRRSGTWATIRYARAQGTRRRVLLGREPGDAPTPTPSKPTRLRGTAALQRR